MTIGWAQQTLLQKDLRLFAQQVYPRYVYADHLDLIIEKLEEVERGICRRLIVTMPPRHGKTLTASHIFPSWYLGNNPDHQIIASTYAQEFADDHGRAVRDLVNSDEYRNVFPYMEVRDDTSAARRWQTTVGGVYRAVGSLGQITGRGANLFLIDDPIKGREDAESELMRRKLKDWYTSVAYTRLEPDGRIVIIQTRWHEDDLAGWVLKEHSHENWELLSLPAIITDDEGEHGLWPERYPLERLHEIRKTLGTRDWASLYMQSPFVDGGQILKEGWWKIWKEKELPKLDNIVIFVDTAYTEKTNNDPCALTVWGRFYDDSDAPQIMCLYGWNEHIEFNPFVEHLMKMGKKYKPQAIIVEPKASGPTVIQELRRRTNLPIYAWQARRNSLGKELSKVARATSVSSLLEGGQIWIADPKDFKWAENIIGECARFPAGSHDDYVDTVTMALDYYRSMGYGVRSDEPDPWANDRKIKRKEPRTYYRV